MRIIGALLVLVLLAGCTSIETVGPVEEVPIGTEPRGVQFAPEPPQPDVTPTGLVEGFIQAMTDPEADYDIARQYLTEGSSAAWDPRRGGAVYSGVVSEEDGSILVRGIRTGSLDDVGRFTATSDELVHDFGVTDVDGEWRISLPPEGVFISDYIFERYWSHISVYFGSNEGNHVVPDVIHVPTDFLTPGRIVEAVVAGPSAAIGVSVRNAVDGGVFLAAEGASVDASGTVTVALSGLDEDMPDEKRRLLGAQLLWSLTAIPRVTGLRIVNDGTPFLLPDQNPSLVLELSSQQGYQVLSRTATTDLFGVQDGVGVRIDSSGRVLPMVSADATVSEVAVSVDGTLVGFIDEARSTVFVGPLGGALLPVSPGRTNLRGAQFSLGNLWFMGDDAFGVAHLMRVSEQGKVVVVDSGELTGELVDFAVAQAGVRVAAVVERAGKRQLMLSSLVEEKRPRLVSVTKLPLLGALRGPLAGYFGLDWSGETDLVVVAETQSVRSIHRARLDGSLVEDLGPLPADPVQVSALPGTGDDAVAARSKDGEVLRHEANNRWTRLEVELQDVSYPG